MAQNELESRLAVPSSMVTRIGVVEDDTLLRTSLAQSLAQSGQEVVFSAGAAKEAIQSLSETDIADLYGWEAVGDIHREFYLLGTDALHDEDLIVLGSQALNKNLAPLFEFWGVPADPATKKIVEALPPATEFIERLELYKTVIPASESQQRSKIERLVESSGNAERWFYYMDNYDPAVADFMEEKIDRLIGEIR